VIFMTQDMSDDKPTILSQAWNSTWILFILTWGDILSLGPCWAPLIYFSCHLLDLILWISQTHACSTMFGQLYERL
jgi:hypothetical protein